MPPALIVSLLLGSLYGLLFFLLAGGAKRGMWAYWLVGALGFLVGQFIAEYVHLSAITLGDVHVIEGSLACWVALFLLYNNKG
jgi:hypothetical protein